MRGYLPITMKINNHQPFRRLPGSNQYADRYAEVRIKPRINAILALVVFTALFYQGIVSYTFYVFGNVKRIAIRDYTDITQEIRNTFTTEAEAPALFNPLPRAYAYELTHRIPPTPEKTAKEIIYSYKHGDILWHIYGLESSFGNADGCLKQGLYNGYGFRQNSSEWVCYKSFQEVTGHVEAWIEAHEGLPLGQILCIYNEGKKKSYCNYAGNFLNL